MPLKKFLVVDSTPANPGLLIWALEHRFPECPVQLCQQAKEAVQILESERVDAIVLHRTNDSDAVKLIKTFLAVAPQVPIIAVSGIDRSEAVLAAGATGFLNYDDWMQLGNVVANVLQQQAPVAVAEAIPIALA